MPRMVKKKLTTKKTTAKPAARLKSKLPLKKTPSPAKSSKNPKLGLKPTTKEKSLKKAGPKTLKKTRAAALKKVPPRAKQSVSKRLAPAKRTTKIDTEAKKPLMSANSNVEHSNERPNLTVGMAAPDFSMPATIVRNVSSEALRGKPFVLYFYPKDDTPGCTTEACGFRDAVPEFGSLGITVIGVSKDSLKSHQKFAEKFGLTFPLASDDGSDTSERFGVWASKSMYGRQYMGIERSTFLIGADGTVRALWRKVSVTGHIDEVKKAVAEL